MEKEVYFFIFWKKKNHETKLFVCMCVVGGDGEKEFDSRQNHPLKFLLCP